MPGCPLMVVQLKHMDKLAEDEARRMLEERDL